MKHGNFISILAAIIIFAAGIYFILRLSPELFEQFDTLKTADNAQAPDFTLQELSGESIRLSDLGGKIVILNFWTSWNEVSLEQLNVLDSFYGAIGKKTEIVILAVNSQENKERVREVAEKEKFQILLDADGVVGELYSIGVVPKTIFIDKNGFLADEIVGIITIADLEKTANKLR